MSSNSNICAVIIDDSAQARKLLRLMLQEIDTAIEIVGEAENADDGLKLIQHLEPHAVFLDIEMPGMTGLQLAEELLGQNYLGKVIFTTAYDQHAIKALRLSALDYLLKPIQEEELLQTITKLSSEVLKTNEFEKLSALSKNLNDGNNTLCIPVFGGYEYIQLSSICYFEAQGSYVRIVCNDGKNKVVAKNLKYFESSLGSSPKFLRIHRSYLVNMDEVVSYSKSDGGSLSLSNGVQIPVSRDRKASIQQFFK
jgi:two-component system LytT family response regulator